MQADEPVAFASRSLTIAQKKYIQIEKEIHGYETFHQYIYRRTVQVETDLKLLEIVFQKPLYRAPQRLQRMLLRLKKYGLQVTYKPGKELILADALSWAYLQTSTDGLDETGCDMDLIS